MDSGDKFHLLQKIVLYLSFNQAVTLITDSLIDVQQTNAVWVD